MTFLKRTLGILFAVMMLFITTACSSPTNSASTIDVPQRSTSDVGRTITDQVNRAGRSPNAIKRDVENLKQQAKENTQRPMDLKAEDLKRAGSQLKDSAKNIKNRLEDQANASVDSANRALNRVSEPNS